MIDANVPFLRQIVLRNYRSIRECDVSLHPLMLLVGPNGSGKSNFLDALRFVAESLRTTMDQALRERGGIQEVRRRSRGHPTHFAIDLELTLPQGQDASYSFRVGAQKQGGFEIQHEHCRIRSNGGPTAEYRVEKGRVAGITVHPSPPVPNDRLYLANASGFTEFRALYDHLAGMGFYSISPDQLRDLQEPGAGHLLERDGRNAASVISCLSKQVRARIEEYLACVAPGVRHVGKRSLGHKETLEFKQEVAGDEDPWSFLAQNMSDGTLRALGVLVSLFQCFDRPADKPIPLIGIEEPEATLHPAAAEVLMGALMEASYYSQVLVTTHSPELMDVKDLDPESLLIVDSERGETIIGPADETNKSVMRNRLYTAGELLKLNQLRPEPKRPKSGATNADQMSLFDNQ